MINAIKKMWDILILIKKWFIPEKIIHYTKFDGTDLDKTGMTITRGDFVKHYPIRDYHIVDIFLTIPRKPWAVKIILIPIFIMTQYFLRLIITGSILMIFAALFVTIWNDVMPTTFNLPVTNIGSIFEIALLFVIPIGLYECLRRFFKI